MPGSVAALLLADGRFPNGGHAHSGGIEEAVNQGLVIDLASLRAFLVGRAWTAGLAVAGVAAAACWLCQDRRTYCKGLRFSQDTAISSPIAPPSEGRTSSPPPLTAMFDDLRALDTEAEARMCSPAQRRISRRLGHQLLRVARTAWPSPLLEGMARLECGVHNGVVLGVVAAVAGLTPIEAASCAAYEAIAGPAGAAVRLLGLDPLAVAALLGELAPVLDRVAQGAVGCLPNGDPTGTGIGWMAQLPAPSAPLLDHLAESHAEREVRLFAS